MADSFLTAITILYTVAAVAYFYEGNWQTACMMAGPVVINIGILGS